jgi:hypothetical protein
MRLYRITEYVGRWSMVDVFVIAILTGLVQFGNLARVDANLGRDWSDEIKAGQDALLSMCKRGVAKGDRFVFTGAELNAANTVMEIHDAQLERCTVAQMEKALHEVIKDIRNRKARAVV